MRITWIGHSCFRIEENGYSIVIDPYEDGSVDGLGNVREEASAVLCTHEHGDHNFRQGVTVIPSGASPFSIETVDTFHDDARGAKRGLDRIYIISDGQTRVAHLGDLGCHPDDCSRLQDLDVMLIPVGGFFTIDGIKAAEIVKELRPRIAIPMHYRSEEKGFGFSVLSTADPFVSSFSRVLTMDASSIESSVMYDADVIVLSPLNVEGKEEK